MAQEKPLLLLSLDGGGIRGLSTILIIEHLMNDFNALRSQDQHLRPCQVFDLIGGSSTGGLIALLLGRLELTVAECKVAYLKILKGAFHPIPIPQKHGGLFSHHSRAKEAHEQNWQESGRLNTPGLEETIREVLAQSTIPNKETLLAPGLPCKSFALAIPLLNASCADPLRTYPNPTLPHGSDPSHAYSTADAILATLSTTVFFEPATVGPLQIQYGDADYIFTNPVQQVYREAHRLWGGVRVDGAKGGGGTGAVIVSIGAGAAPGTGVLEMLGAVENTEAILAIRAMITALTSIEEKAEAAARQFESDNPEFGAQTERVFRFAVSAGTGLDSVWFEEGKQIQAVEKATGTYLEGENERVGKCVERLDKVLA